MRKKFVKINNGKWVLYDNARVVVNHVLSGQTKVYRLIVNGGIVGEFGTLRDALNYTSKIYLEGVI